MSASTTLSVVSRTAGSPDLWLALPADHPDLLFEMAARMGRLSTLSRVERDRAVAELLDYEAGLPEAELRTVVVAELRSLISLPLEAARDIQGSIDRFLQCRPAEFSMRRKVAVQRACRDLNLDEINRLESLMPNARVQAGLPPLRTDVGAMPWGTSRAIVERPRRWSVSRLLGRP